MFNLETAVEDDKVIQSFDLESFMTGGTHPPTEKAPFTSNSYPSNSCITLPSSTAASKLKDVASLALYSFMVILFLSTQPLVANPSQKNISELDRLIPPEIKNDAFYTAIYNLVRKEPVQSILEIGSSSGAGSTDAFIKGMKKNRSHPTLFCMELSNTRFKALQEHYANNPSVICYHASSVPLERFPEESEVLDFMETVDSNLRYYGSTEVIRWLKQDIEYVKNSNVPQNGIELVKSEHNIKDFDVVLIDGSEFTGQAELALVYGAKFILLDDICTFKNHNNYIALINDVNYNLIEKNQYLRNGYAIFKKK
ncbi:MAG: hypothetical protein WCF65_04215 [Parachlamydiaceae bacterium]